jgi:hypothetical protein
VRIYYDWEFLEDGRTIKPISIGMVAEDGRELYLINRDAPLDRIRNHAWLMENVVPSLPLALIETPPALSRSLAWNELHPDYDKVSSPRLIASLVHDFINGLESLPDGADGPDAELWGWYPAYDHVVLCQLWGPMVDKPPGIPMQTFDVHQEAVRLGNPEFPDFPVKLLPGNYGKLPEHHALADALECKARHEWLMAEESRLRAAQSSADHFGCPGKGKLHVVIHDGPCLP